LHLLQWRSMLYMIYIVDISSVHMSYLKATFNSSNKYYYYYYHIILNICAQSVIWWSLIIEWISRFLLIFFGFIRFNTVGKCIRIIHYTICRKKTILGINIYICNILKIREQYSTYISYLRINVHKKIEFVSFTNHKL